MTSELWSTGVARSMRTREGTNREIPSSSATEPVYQSSTIARAASKNVIGTFEEGELVEMVRR